MASHAVSVSMTTHPSCVVDEAEVGLVTEVRLLELGMCGMLSSQFVHQSFVGGFGEPALFIHQSKNTQWLLEQVDGGLKVKAEVDEGPFDALPLVLFLLQDKHGVVEQLLELLVGVVDTQLLEGVHLQDTRGTDNKWGNHVEY